MDLSDVKFVIDLEYVSDVNRYLQKGWILLKTYTKSYDSDFAKEHLTMHYVLGANSEIDYSKELSDLTAYDNLKIGIDLDEISNNDSSENNEDIDCPF